MFQTRCSVTCKNQQPSFLFFYLIKPPLIVKIVSVTTSKTSVFAKMKNLCYITLYLNRHNTGDNFIEQEFSSVSFIFSIDLVTIRRPAPPFLNSFYWTVFGMGGQNTRDGGPEWMACNGVVIVCKVTQNFAHQRI